MEVGSVSPLVGRLGVMRLEGKILMLKHFDGPHSYAPRVAICKLDAGRFERGADRGDRAIFRCFVMKLAAGLMTVAERLLREDLRR